MSGQSFGDFVNEWQTGALLVLASVVVGFATGSIAAVDGQYIFGVLGFAVGAVGTFLLLSYLLYGR
ncbi:hypothetical protein [Haloarcula laminariae]|uniref:hypothetical protein n=1 Tax=Haloarcula laminariae TaxID=2961577 RepID=UPI00240680A9|nr:hypothetical protein [Halomicroarcula sp. FL173]